jgi:hypothetical protein
MVKIYTLKDPITNQIRYVGKTKKELRDRWYSHCSNYKLEREKSHKNSWIISLKRQGVKPIIELLDEVPKLQWQFWESYWISQIQSWGFNLTNMTKGGEGCNGGSGSLGYKHTEEAKNSIGVKNAGPKSLEWVFNATNAMKKAVAKPIVQKDLQGNTVKRHLSFYTACKEINIGGNSDSTKKNIHACCNKKRKTAYNFIWEYESIES